jgi:PAS domain S-box-containing protein
MGMDDGKIRVLMIDDDPDDYHLTRELLADLPENRISLEWAADFDAGREAIACGEHDAYLLDFWLGKGDGLSLLREAVRRGCKAPVIFVTGQGDRDLGLKALNEGAADYLVKGKFDALGLERAIRHALQQRRHAAELEQKVADRTAELERANTALRQTEARLAAELVDTKLLQSVSAEIIHEQNLEAIYDKIMDAAVGIMRAEFASMQTYYPERGSGGELRLLAFRGFDPAAAKFWEWVSADSNCTCGVALKTRERCVAADIPNCEFMAGTPDQATYLQAGIVACQSTPLVSRSGTLLGMISTHWNRPHEPSERELRLLDILARQTADLIERKHAEEALRSSEERHRQTLSLMPAAVYSIDASGVITYFNERAAQLWGRKPRIGDTDELFCGSEQMMLPDGTVLPHEDCPMAAVLRDGQSFRDTEVHIRRPDGSIVHVRVNVEAIRDGHGTIVGAINAFYDISALNQAEQALRDSEERFRRLVEGAPFGMYIVDSQFRIAHMNARSQTGAFRNVPSVIGRDFSDAIRILWPEEVAQQVIQVFRHTLDTGEPYYSKDFVNPRSDIEAVEGYEWELQRLRLADGTFGVVCYYYDSSDLRRTEHALRDSEERKAAIIESAIDCLITMDHEGRIIDFNPAAERTFGYRRGDVLGKTVADTIIPPPLRQSHREGLERFLRTGEARVLGRLLEMPAQRADGSEFPAEISITSVQRNGGPPCFTAFLRDISERKRIQEERQTMLESERAARSEAEHAGRMKDEFLATLSHELRTPLNAILGYATLIRMANLEGDELIEATTTIERNAKAQAQLIEDLLDMNRIISGKVCLDIQALDLSEVIEAALGTVRPSAEAKQIRLQTFIDPQAGPVRGDPGRIQQVVWNLLSNAVKFTPKNGKIQVALERVNSHVEIRVTDSGQGICADFLPHVFDRFRQADASTTRHHGGLGLGLAIVKQLVESHGGTVIATSPGEGQGATFVVALPIATVHAHASDSKREHPRTPVTGANRLDIELAGIRVLVVDDEPDATALVQRVLQDCNAEVEKAACADDAVGLLTAKHFHVLVSDIGMPGEDGYQLIRRVRALGGQKGQIPAVALTAFARTEDRRRAALAGFHTHLAKPVEASELLAIVASLAGRTGR